MINVARGTYQLERVRFDALNPTFLLAVVKGALVLGWCGRWQT